MSPLLCQLSSAATASGVLAEAELAATLGYSGVAHSHVASWDPFTMLATVAARTPAITLSTAVTPIYSRPPAATAQAAATLDALSGGRFHLGLGVGHRSTMAGFYGERIGSPVAEVREYVAIVRAILRGEPVPAGERWPTSFALTAPGPRRAVPILLAALSPRMIRLAGEIADGVLLWSCSSAYVRDVVVPEARAGRARAGLPLDGFAIMPIVPAAAAGDAATVASLRGKLHRPFGLPFYRAMFSASGFDAELAAFDAAAGDRARQEAAISDRVVDGLSALGDVAGGVARFRAAGATHPILSAVPDTDFAAALRAAAPLAR